MRFTLKINRNNDFRRIYARGKSFVDPCLVTYVTKTGRDELKIGITAAKKVGCAVKRNRARRLIKAAYTLLEPNLKKGYNVVLVARALTPKCKMQQIYKAMEKHLCAAGILEK